MSRPKLDTADRSTRAKLARAAAELASASDQLEQRTTQVRIAQRALSAARREYAETWEELAEALREAHRSGVSAAELRRITGFGIGFIRPIILGLTTAPRAQGRRARQVEDGP